MDVLWWHIAWLVIPGTTAKRFKHLPKVAGLVLVLPHSNAGEEQLFKGKNKTESRASMKLKGTLSSLLAMKLQYPEQTVPCHMWSPTKELLDSSKKAVLHITLSTEFSLVLIHWLDLSCDLKFISVLLRSIHVLCKL